MKRQGIDVDPSIRIAQRVAPRLEEYDVVKERRNGTRVYRAHDKESYLRAGSPHEIDEEIRFHRRLLIQGYPVPEILAEGDLEDGERYFREVSAGESHFGGFFREDVMRTGAIQPETFQSFLTVVEKYCAAQKKEQPLETNWESVYLATQFDTLLNELPEKRDEILAIWKKAQDNLREAPFVPCHGDFGPFNVLPGGVIDFETSFAGPLGYDLVSATTTGAWFPRSGDAEVLRSYSFDREQLAQLHALLPDGGSTFEALAVLRSSWLVVGLQRWPKLQKWRYERLEEMMKRYLQDEPLQQWLYNAD